MKILIKYELKKIASNKSCTISVGLLMILIIILSFSGISGEYWIKVTGEEIIKTEAIQMKKEALHHNAGYLTEDKLSSVISEYQAAYQNPDNFSTGQDGNELTNTAFAKYVQVNADIQNLIRSSFAPDGEAYDYNAIDSLSPEDARNFYHNRIKKVNEYLNMDYSYGNYSEKEKEYWNDKNEKIATPFYYDYNEGWKQLLGGSTIVFLAIITVICVCLAPVFASEYQTGADSVILSAKYGRSKLITAKVSASFIVTSLVYLLSMTIYTTAVLCIFGGEGWNCSLQVLNFTAPSNVNLLQAYLFVIFAGYCICLLMQGITLLLSAKMASPFPVIICMLVILFLPIFISYSKSSRLFNNVLNLLPGKMTGAYTALTKYELYHIAGISIPYPNMMIIVSLFIGFVTLPFAFKAFRKHQVA